MKMTFAQERHAEYECKLAQMKADEVRDRNDHSKKNPPAKSGDYCWPSEEIIR